MTLTNISLAVSQRINDPNNDEVAAAASGSNDMMRWINLVAQDAAMLTDCLQKQAWNGTAGAYVSGTGTAESFVTTTAALGITSGALLWRVLSVVNTTTGIRYRAVSREEYYGYRTHLITNSLTDPYIYSVFGFGASRSLYVLPLVANAIKIGVEFSETHPTITYSAGTEEPSGLLASYQNIFIEGVAAKYFQTVNDEENEREAFGRYIDEVRRLAGEVGTNPTIEPQMSSLYRFIGKTMKELKNANGR